MKIEPLRRNFHKMKILKLNADNFRQLINEAAKSIKNGEVIICPTDTVYGLLCNAVDRGVVQRLFQIKKRKTKKPLPIFVKDINAAKGIAFIDREQENFLKKIWPGKITVIFKKKKGTKIYGADKKTIGLRIPNYRLVNNLLKKLNFPLTGTSANISGKPASTKIKELINQFKKQNVRPDLIIDAGNLKKSLPSTIIDLTSRKIKIIRTSPSVRTLIKIIRTSPSARTLMRLRVLREGEVKI